MDITILFRACVKSIRSRNKVNSNSETKPYSILKKTNRDLQLHKAKDIIKQVAKLQNFFTENKAAYLNVVNYLSTNKTMTEESRVAIDIEAQKIIHTCASMISDYKKEIAALQCSNQVKEHYLNVIELTENYLKSVSKSYTEAKATRVKKVIEMHKISKLETVGAKAVSPPVPVIPKESNVSMENVEEDLSPEELQLFESENSMLYNELNSLSDEVNQVESKVVKIAELQELFTEKILQQEKDIDRIVNTTAATTDTMKNANEQIRQAIRRNSGLRIWVLCFLITMSFSLLFLDWYNE